MSQSLQPTQFGRDRASEIRLGEIDEVRVGELGKLGRHRSRQPSWPHFEMLQIRKQPYFSRQRRGEQNGRVQVEPCQLKQQLQRGRRYRPFETGIHYLNVRHNARGLTSQRGLRRTGLAHGEPRTHGRICTPDRIVKVHQRVVLCLQKECLHVRWDSQ